MSFYLEGAIALIVMLGTMGLALELGRCVGLQRWRKNPEQADKGTSSIEGAVFGLMGLLIAFTFSGGMNRLDARRDLILKESNALGTLWARLDLLPEANRDRLRQQLRSYLDLRIAATRASELKPSPAINAAQLVIWREVVEATRGGPTGVTMLVIPAVNEVFDLAGARYMAVSTHPSPTVYVLLVILALVCSVLAGYGLAVHRERSWLHQICFILSLLAALYVIMDTEFPRVGIITVQRFDTVLVDLSASWK